MKDKDRFSDELISAFVDGELDAEARAELLSDEHQDERLCEARKLKELVRHAYLNPPDVQKKETRSGRGRLAGNIAAGLALVFTGILGGFLLSGVAQPDRGAGSSGDARALTMPASDNLLLHVTSGDESMMMAALDYAEAALRESRQSGVPRQVEVVANEAGLNLLRSDVSPFAERVRRMSRENRQLVFYACSRAVERLEEQGVEVHLLPDARTGQSALDRVVLRMQEGWAYHKI